MCERYVLSEISLLSTASPMYTPRAWACTRSGSAAAGVASTTTPVSPNRRAETAASAFLMDMSAPGRAGVVVEREGGGGGVAARPRTVEPDRHRAARRD